MTNSEYYDLHTIRKARRYFRRKAQGLCKHKFRCRIVIYDENNGNFLKTHRYRNRVNITL